jgi:hypothetical protein
VEDERPRVFPFNRRVEVGPLLPHHLDARGDAHRFELVGQEAGAGDLVAGGVAGVDLHVLLQKLHLGEVGVVAVDPLLGRAGLHRLIEELDQAVGHRPGQQETGVEGQAGRPAPANVHPCAWHEAPIITKVSLCMLIVQCAKCPGMRP